jgi:hypothetical protein
MIRVLGLLALAIAATPALAEEFSARLGRVPVDSRNQASITGIGHASAELDGDRLRIEGEFSGLGGAATVANLHVGPAVGVRGEPIHELTLDKAVEGKLSGTVRLTDSELAALRAGRLYIQIHSEAAPDGNLFGWLLEE